MGSSPSTWLPFDVAVFVRLAEVFQHRVEVSAEGGPELLHCSLNLAAREGVRPKVDRCSCVVQRRLGVGPIVCAGDDELGARRVPDRLSYEEHEQDLGLDAGEGDALVFDSHGEPLGEREALRLLIW